MMLEPDPKLRATAEALLALPVLRQPRPWRVAPLPLHLGDGQAGCGGRGNGSQEGACASSQDGPWSSGGGKSFPKKGCITILPQPLPYPPGSPTSTFPFSFLFPILVAVRSSADRLLPARSWVTLN